MENNGFYLMDGRARYERTEYRRERAIVLEACGCWSEATANMYDYGTDTTIARVMPDSLEMVYCIKDPLYLLNAGRFKIFLDKWYSYKKMLYFAERAKEEQEIEVRMGRKSPGRGAPPRNRQGPVTGGKDQPGRRHAEQR